MVVAPPATNNALMITSKKVDLIIIINNMITIKEYCEKKEISQRRFREICDISEPWVYENGKKLDMNMETDTCKKICDGTLKEFGEGLSIHEYLNIN
jgi:hypothetical protein